MNENRFPFYNGMQAHRASTLMRGRAAKSGLVSVAQFTAACQLACQRALLSSPPSRGIS